MKVGKYRWWEDMPCGMCHTTTERTCDSSSNSSHCISWCTSQYLRPFTSSASIGVIIIIDQYLIRKRPDIQIYLIKQMAFSHPTSNNMLCDHTFMCPRRLFSSFIGSWLKCPRLQYTTILSLFQLPEVYKQGKFSQIIQSHLCCCLDNSSPRPASTSTSAAASGCSITRPQELVPVSPCLCPPRGPQTFTRKSSHSQECAR